MSPESAASGATSSVAVVVPNRRGPLSFARRHPLAGYFTLAFAGSWIIEGLYGILQPTHLLPSWWLDLLTFLGPTAAAFIMSAVVAGRAGVFDLLRRYVRLRAGPQWYLLVLLGIPTLTLLGYLALPGAPAALRLPPASFLRQYAFSYVLTFLLDGPLGEEPGWRGFALPRLQQAHGPLVGSLILGLFWAFWHLPLFLFVFPNYNGAGNSLLDTLRAFAVFVLWVAGITVLFTWIFNRTRGSLLFVMLAHASINTSFGFGSTILPGFNSLAWVSGASVISAAVILLAAALLVVELTRGRLGYAGDPGAGKQ